MRAWLTLLFKASPRSSECFPEIWHSATSPFPTVTTQYFPCFCPPALAPWLKASTSETTGGYFPSAGACSKGADVALARGPGMASQRSHNGQKLRCWSWVVPLANGPEDSAAGGQYYTYQFLQPLPVSPFSTKPGSLGPGKEGSLPKTDIKWPSPFQFSPNLWFHHSSPSKQTGTPSIFFFNIQHVGISGGSHSSWY